MLTYITDCSLSVLTNKFLLLYFNFMIFFTTSKGNGEHKIKLEYFV